LADLEEIIKDSKNKGKPDYPGTLIDSYYKGTRVKGK